MHFVEIRRGNQQAADGGVVDDSVYFAKVANCFFILMLYAVFITHIGLDKQNSILAEFIAQRLGGFGTVLFIDFRNDHVGSEPEQRAGGLITNPTACT